jgi:hypothetical protein
VTGADRNTVDGIEIFELLGMFELLDVILRPTTKKSRGRPVAAQTIAIRDAILALQDDFDQVTVRGAFYQLTTKGVVEKTEAGYRQVQRQALLMRRENLLPWKFIADGTRWVHAPETWDSTEDALRETARTYRRNLWRSQDVRIEVWLEKDALASLIRDVTYRWGVRLMVSRGQSSDTYVHGAAQEAQKAWDEAGVSTEVLALYDADRSGRSCVEQIKKKLLEYSYGAPINVTLLAVTDEQIDEWNLPTRPAKENADEVAVELDAIPPDKLKTIVEDAIVSHIDADAWKKEQAVEESEREILERLTASGGVA